jgi:hypothetical protein
MGCAAQHQEFTDGGTKTRSQVFKFAGMVQEGLLAVSLQLMLLFGRGLHAWVI